MDLYGICQEVQEVEAKVVQEVRGLFEEVEIVFSLRSLGDLCTQLQLRREEALRLGRLRGRVVFRVRVGRLEGGGKFGVHSLERGNRVETKYFNCFSFQVGETHGDTFQGI